MKKVLTILGIFILITGVIYSDILLDYIIKYEAKELKEFPFAPSLGDCRIQAVQKAYKLGNAEILFFETRNNTIHAITIDNKNLVYDLSASAKKYDKIDFDGIPKNEYIKLSPIDKQKIVYKISLKNKKIIPSTEYMNKKYNADTYKNYVSIFIQELVLKDNNALDDE
jgi:hypothetical protein